MRSIIFFITVITICMIPVRYCFANLGEDNNQFICKENNIDYQKAQEFLNKFNKLVQENDRKAIAKMVDYPVRINKSKKTGEIINYDIEDENEFLGQYHSFFNETNNKYLDKHHNLDCDPLGYISTAGGNFYFNYSEDGIKIAIINS